MSGFKDNITIFGDNHFLDQYLLSALLKEGSWSINLVVDQDPETLMSFYHKTLPEDLNLSRLQIVNLYQNFNKLKEFLEKSYVFLNTFGKFNKGGLEFGANDAVTYEYSKKFRTIVKACKSYDDKIFIHLSYFGADVDSQCLFLRQEGEELKQVRQSIKNATIVHMGLPYAKADYLFSQVADYFCQRRVLVLPKKAKKAKWQVIHMNELVKALVKITNDIPAFAGKEYALSEPEVWRVQQLYQLIAFNTCLPQAWVVTAHDKLLKLLAKLDRHPFSPISNLYHNQLMSTDITNPNQSHYLSLEHLKIEPSYQFAQLAKRYYFRN